MEVVRDKADNCIIICSIENLDPMGVHTGDSITVAPAQTLTDKEYQIMRNASLAVLREIGVDTGGSNVQFSVNPKDGRMIVIEMNPRVSRSSALASKATGFPIAKVAAKLAVGYTLDELRTKSRAAPRLPRSSPAIDYVVTKIPRFAFEKFPTADSRLTTQMKSVGEVMAMGRTFQESFQKALRGLEVGVDGMNEKTQDRETLEKELGEPGPERIWYVGDAFAMGLSVDEVHDLTKIDKWFLVQIEQIVKIELDWTSSSPRKGRGRPGCAGCRHAAHAQAKGLLGPPPGQAAQDHRKGRARSTPCAERAPGVQARGHLRRRVRHQHGLHVLDLRGRECEASRPPARRRSWCWAVARTASARASSSTTAACMPRLAMREDGYETIMVNCNPETVSTDYDTSDRLYFEPVTLEDVLEIVDKEKPVGVIVQYGGQTPLEAGAGPGSRRRAHHRHQPRHDRRRRRPRALPEAAARPGPAPAAQRHGPHRARSAGKGRRPGLPAGGAPQLRAGWPRHGNRARAARPGALHARSRQGQQRLARAAGPLPERRHRVRCGLRARPRGKVFIGGVMEHIEQAGVHSGDSACSLPPYYLSQPPSTNQAPDCGHGRRPERGGPDERAVRHPGSGRQGRDLRAGSEPARLAHRALRQQGHGHPAGQGGRALHGRPNAGSQGITKEVTPPYFSVKEAVFPFVKFPGVDTILGPEMKSTGEVMGVGKTFGEAFVKSQLGAGTKLPRPPHGLQGVPDTVKNSDKPRAVEVARQLVAMGFELVATKGTAPPLPRLACRCSTVNKVTEGRPHIVDMIKNNEIALVINTVEERRNAIADSRAIRTSSLLARVTTFTTIAGAEAAVEGMKYMDKLDVISVQEMHAQLAPDRVFGWLFSRRKHGIIAAEQTPPRGNVRRFPF
jgi:carbamoyl-phosphate synthase large subunit